MNLIQQQIKQQHLVEMLEKGQAEQKAGNVQLAEAIYCGVLNDNPHDLNAQFLYASCMQQQGKNGLAISMYEKLLQFLPDTPAIYNNMGGCYHQENFDKEAFESYSMALRLTKGKDTDVLSNLGGMFVNTGNPEKGEEYFKKLFEINPNHSQGKWNYSLICLEQERFGEGFDLYDEGFKTNDRKYKDYKLPEWEGQECNSIVVCGEQGIGDEIMFSSLFEDLSKKAKLIVYDCHPRLSEIMENYSAIDSTKLIIHPSRKETDVEWVKEFGCEYRLNIGSLGKFFRRDKKSFDIPARKGFLKPNSERLIYWKKEIDKLGPGLKVGISWFGGNKRTRTDKRSIPLQSFLPMLDIDGIRWINAQYNMSKETLDGFDNHYGIKINYMASDDDFYDWTMMCLACDFHISVCNSLVHTMGAYGHKIYCLVPYGAAWRYGLKDDRMAWYDSPKLIRQTIENDWSHPLVEMMNILNSMTEKKVA